VGNLFWALARRSGLSEQWTVAHPQEIRMIVLARALMAAALAFAIVPVLPSGAHAEDRHVRIINETRNDIHEFYASNVGADDWEEDILGADVLPSGDSLVINIDDGTGYCKFDFRAVFDDGTDLVKHNVNVCEIDSFRYTSD
jgi:hypothetical protein